MEWTIQQIVVTLIGVIIAGIIMYYSFQQIAWAGPTPNVEQNVLPLFIGMNIVRKRCFEWKQ